jgi:hypothetical protein
VQESRVQDRGVQDELNGEGGLELRRRDGRACVADRAAGPNLDGGEVVGLPIGDGQPDDYDGEEQSHCQKLPICA